MSASRKPALTLLVPFLVGDLLALAVAGGADAAPLDLFDATPRSVSVELEASTDLSVVGQRWRPPLSGSFTSDGTVATVTVPGAALETLYCCALDPIPGSFDDFVIEIDVATREAVVLPFTMGFLHATGTGFSLLTQTLSTTAIGGFVLGSVWCAGGETPLGPCQLVDAEPYDPSTGTLNAIGRVVVPFNPEVPDQPVPDLFSPDGDLRLLEVPEPGTALLLAVALAACLATGQSLGKRRVPANSAKAVIASHRWSP